jgi:hypothetical protein
LCLCCGKSASFEEHDERKRPLLVRHHSEGCSEYLAPGTDKENELKMRLAEACRKFNEERFSNTALAEANATLTDEIQRLRTYYAAVVTPECPDCKGETVFLAEAYAKENVHYYRCRNCAHHFSRAPVVA